MFLQRAVTRKAGIIFTVAASILLASCVFAEKHEKPVNESRIITTEGLSSVQIKTISENIVFEPSQEDAILVSLTGTTSSAKVLFLVEKKGSELIIECDQDSWMFFSDLKLTVTLPTALFSTIDVKSVSGEIRIKDMCADDGITLKTVSGSINATGIRGRVDSKTVSGAITILYADKAHKTTAKSTSGNVNIHIPADSSFTYEMDSSSGYEACDFSSGNTGTVGSSSTAHVSIKTTSGDIRIRKS